MTDAPKFDTQAPERVIAWPNDDDRYSWAEGGCRSEDLAGPDADYGTWYVRADLADARAAAAWQEMRIACLSAIPDPGDDNPRAQGMFSATVRGIAKIPVPDASAALDRLIAERVREAVEEAARKADEQVSVYRRSLDHDLLQDDVRHADLMRMGAETAEIIAASIRARGSKEGQS